MTQKQERKLLQACLKLDLTMAEAINFIQVSELPEVACWGYDKEKEKHFIFINPKVLNYSVPQIETIIRHEILHYAGYKGGKQLTDKPLCNLALDVAVNKILYSAYPHKMRSLSRRIYPEKTKQSPIALARCDIPKDEIQNEKIRKLWSTVWETEKCEVPSPTSLYYQLFEFRDQSLQDNPFYSAKPEEGAGEGKNQVILRGEPGKKSRASDSQDRMRSLAEKVAEAAARDAHFKYLHERRAFSNAISSTFTHLLAEKESFDVSEISDFIQQLQIRQKLDETTAKITDALNGKNSTQVYPYQLSRLGIIYLSLGISDITHLYWNKTPESRKNKLAVYIDTSPSMNEYKEMEVYLIEQLKDSLPTKVFSFAGSIKEIDVEEFAKGRYYQGCSTSFNAVIEHFMDSDFDAAVIFTDGFSSVKKENQEQFKGMNKRLFAVYFTERESITSDLDNISETSLKISRRR